MHAVELSSGLGAWEIHLVNDSPDARYSTTLRACTRRAHSSDQVLCTVCVWERPDLILGMEYLGQAGSAQDL